MKVFLKDARQLGNEIRLFRMQRHWSQTDLAKQLIVSPQAISNWERGESYMSLDIVVQLSYLMGLSLDELLLYDVHGEYSYASIFDRVRIRDFWMDIVDITKQSLSGEMLIDLRIQYDRHSFFVEEIFSLSLLSDKDKEIPFTIYGWVLEPSEQSNELSNDIKRVYRISYRLVHHPKTLVIHYNSYTKHFDLNDDYIGWITEGFDVQRYKEDVSEMERKIIEFFMKSNNPTRLLEFINQQNPSDKA